MASQLGSLDPPVHMIKGHVASRPITLRFRNRGSGGSIITRADDSSKKAKTIFKADMKRLGVGAHRRVFHDAEGNAIFDLRRAWQSQDSLICRPGDESHLARIAPRASIFKDKFDVYIPIADGGKDLVFEVRGQDIWKKNTFVYLGDQLVMQTRLINYLSIYVPLMDNQWDVYVCQGMDLSLTAAIVGYLAAALYDSVYFTSRAKGFSGGVDEKAG